MEPGRPAPVAEATDGAPGLDVAALSPASVKEPAAAPSPSMQQLAAAPAGATPAPAKAASSPAKKPAPPTVKPAATEQRPSVPAVAATPAATATPAAAKAPAASAAASATEVEVPKAAVKASTAPVTGTASSAGSALAHAAPVPAPAPAAAASSEAAIAPSPNPTAAKHPAATAKKPAAAAGKPVAAAHAMAPAAAAKTPVSPPPATSANAAAGNASPALPPNAAATPIAVTPAAAAALSAPAAPVAVVAPAAAATLAAAAASATSAAPAAAPAAASTARPAAARRAPALAQKAPGPTPAAQAAAPSPAAASVKHAPAAAPAATAAAPAKPSALAAAEPPGKGPAEDPVSKGGKAPSPPTASVVMSEAATGSGARAASVSGAAAPASVGAQHTTTPSPAAPERPPAVVAAAPAPAKEAPGVRVVLEDNPTGHVSVSLPPSELDPEGEGEVMVADLVTAAMKALKARYGPVHAGPSVKVFFVDPAAGERRWLPTYDSVPAKLLKEGGEDGGAGIALQGILCGEAPTAFAAQRPSVDAPNLPLPGCTEVTDVKPMSPITEDPASMAAGFSGKLGSGAHVNFISDAVLANHSTGQGPSLSAGLRGSRPGSAVETLCVESAAPSATSVYSMWRGGRLPSVADAALSQSARRLRLQASASASALDSGAIGSDGEEEGERGPGHGAASGPVREAFVTATGADMASAVAMLPTAASKDTTGNAMLLPTESKDSAAAAAAAPGREGSGDAGSGDASGGAPGAPTPDAAPSAVALGAADGAAVGAETEEVAAAAGGAGGDMVKKDSKFLHNVSTDDIDETSYQTPPLEWSDLMGPDAPEEQQQEPSGGMCLGLFSIFSSSKAQQQQQWRARLRTAITAQDPQELSAWLDFRNSGRGSRDQAEVDAVLWLAVEARAAGLVRLLLQQGGTKADTPRPRRPVASSSGNLTGLGKAKVVAEDKWLASKAGSGEVGGVDYREGLTPLMRAAEMPCAPLVEVLLACGADATAAQPSTGWTALHRALLASPPGPAPADGEAADAAGGDAATPGRSAWLRCAKLLMQRTGLQAARKLRTRGRHEDDLLRFTVRHGRSAALRWLLSAGLRAEPAAAAAAAAGKNGADAGQDADVAADVASCAYLAGKLGRTVEVWDLPPPRQPLANAGPPARDPARPGCWLLGEGEAAFVDQRRQLLMGAAAAGRLEVISTVLAKPPPHDRLRREELDAALSALRGAQPPPRNAAAVEAALSAAAHPYMSWEGKVLPALHKVDSEAVSSWIAKDRPSPAEVDRALAELLGSERLALPLWQDGAAATFNALVAAGADVEYAWEAAAQEEAAPEVAAAPEARGGRSLWPLRAALQVPAPAMVRLLLAAGADPLRKDGAGENALCFAVRVAAGASRGGEAGAEQACQALDGGRSVKRAAGGGGGDAVALAAATECIAALLSSKQRARLLAATNAEGLTPSFLAAVSDLRGVLRQLCDAGDDPWVAMVPAPPRAPGAPAELLGAAAPKRGVWTVGHEAARCGALSTLGLLLGGGAGGGGGRKPPPSTVRASSEAMAARYRDALIGAIRGGRVGAAKMALDAGGAAGSLHDAELQAALALCKASAELEPPLPLPCGTYGCGADSADPPRYEALAAFLSSRAHVHMDWEREVMPALRAGNAGVIRRWVAADRVGAAAATNALCVLTEVVQQCNVSVGAGGVPGAIDSGGGGGRESSDGGGLAGQLMAELAGLSSAMGDKGRDGRGVADVAMALIKAGADVNYATPVVTAEEGGGGADGAAAAGDGAGVASGGVSLLMQAASKGHLPLVEVLLAMGARVDAEDATGFTAVDHAVLSRKRLGDGAVLDRLLEAYGERRLNAHRTQGGDSALMLAVRAADAEAVKQLLDAGASPAAADASAPPLISAPSLIRRVGSGGGEAAAGAAVGGGDEGPAEGGSMGAEPAGAGRRALRSVPSGARVLTSMLSTAPNRGLTSMISLVPRRGSAVYLAALLDDKTMLHSLLRGATNGGEAGLDACRQEVQLGALHGGRLALLEASLGVPEGLKSLAPPGEAGGGSAAFVSAEEACSRLAEQASSRAEEARTLLRELDLAVDELIDSSSPAAAAASAPCADPATPAQPDANAPIAPGVPLTHGDLARARAYLGAKAETLGRLREVHAAIGAFYGRCRARMAGLERQLEERREQVAARIRTNADAQARLLAAQHRLSASREAVMRSVLSRRDAALDRLEAALERRLAALGGAARRAEGQLSNQVETIIMDMRKLVARRINEIDAKKAEGSKALEKMEQKLDAMWGRKQRQLAGRPPALRIALNQRMAVLTQQLAAARGDLTGRVDAALRKVEAQQRRGTGLVDLQALRSGVARRQQETAALVKELAQRARDAVVDRAHSLLAADKHDELLRIVGRMVEEVGRQGAAAAAASSRALAELAAAFASAEATLLRAAGAARLEMQGLLFSVVSDHSKLVKTLVEGSAAAVAAAAAADKPASLTKPLPDLDKALQGLDVSNALEVLEGMRDALESGPLGGGVQNVATVEETVEGVIMDMNDNVRLAFPDAEICDALEPSELTPLLDAEADLDLSGLGVEALRDEVAALDFALPDLSVDLRSVDLSALEDDGRGSGAGAGGRVGLTAGALAAMDRASGGYGGAAAGGGRGDPYGGGRGDPYGGGGRGDPYGGGGGGGRGRDPYGSDPYENSSDSGYGGGGGGRRARYSEEYDSVSSPTRYESISDRRDDFGMSYA